MKRYQMKYSFLLVFPMVVLIFLFQNCGPAKLTGQGVIDGASVLPSEVPGPTGTTSPIGTKVDLTALLQAQQETETNVLYPAQAASNTYDYALGAPIVENLVLLKNDFTLIKWVHGPTETVVGVGDAFYQKEFSAAMEGAYYIIGYRGETPSLISHFNLLKKTVPTVAVDVSGAVQFSQKLVFSDSASETILVQAEAPTVDLASVQATLKPAGTLISGKRSFIVTKKTTESINAEFKITDAAGKILTKVINLPAKLRPTPTTETQVLMFEQPTINVIGGETIILVPQFNAVPMAKDYFVFILFVDASGLLRSDLTTNYTPVVPTSKWNGLIQFTQNLKIPTTLPAGTYSIRVGLYDIVGRTPLAMGPGVVVDNQLRYTVGTLIKK